MIISNIISLIIVGALSYIMLRFLVSFLIANERRRIFKDKERRIRFCEKHLSANVESRIKQLMKEKRGKVIRKNEKEFLIKDTYLKKKFAFCLAKYEKDIKEEMENQGYKVVPDNIFKDMILDYLRNVYGHQEIKA